MTNYNDGEIHGWGGGSECPVHPKSQVRVWIPDGEALSEYATTSAELCDWRLIRAFKVVEAYVEPPKPREVWVNEYPEGLNWYTFYTSEKVARDNAADNAIRQVRFIEAPK